MPSPSSIKISNHGSSDLATERPFIANGSIPIQRDDSAIDLQWVDKGGAFIRKAKVGPFESDVERDQFFEQAYIQRHLHKRSVAGVLPVSWVDLHGQPPAFFMPAVLRSDRNQCGINWRDRLRALAIEEPGRLSEHARNCVLAPPLSDLVSCTWRDVRCEAAFTQQICDHLVILAQVCAIAHRAHLAGICHLSIKSKDIIVGPENVYLADWEMACFKGANEFVDVRPRFSADGRYLEKSGYERRPFAGNYIYMPPEQANKQEHAVGVRSDVFWIGASAFEIITGLPPFWDGVEQCLTKLSATAQRGEIPWHRVPDLPVTRAVAKALQRALAYDVYERYTDPIFLRDVLLLAIEPFRSVARESKE